MLSISEVNFIVCLFLDKSAIQKYNSSLTKYAIGLCKRDLRILVGLLTGHNWLNRHLKVMNIRENSLCPLCDEDDETSVHLLGNCPATMVNRNALMGACTFSSRGPQGFPLVYFTEVCQKLR